MKRYESYKPSGVDWIGDVPKEWKVAPFKRFLSEAMKYGANASAEEENDLFPRYIRITDIDENGRLKDDDIKSLNNNDSKDYMLEKGDLLFARSGATVGKTYLFDESFRACYAGYLIKAKCDKKLLPKFVVYYTQSSIYDNWKSASFIQSTIQNISAERYSMLPMLVPPVEEQTAIVAYLDSKCAKIDNVVAVQQQRIELLKELKQSIITHAVTKGLDKNAKLKPSGVDWIDNVPNEWNIFPFKALFSTEKGLSFTKADLVDEGIPVISYGQIHSKSNDFITTKECLLRYIPANIIPHNSKSSVKIGDFIFADTSEDIEGSGNFAYIDKNGIYAGYHTIIAKSMCPENSRYFSFLFQTDCWRSQIRNSVSGVKVYSITKQILTSVKMLVPPVEEQTAIADYLDKKCATIDKQISKVERQIELLKEYKQSVITECVTGKRKVC